MCASAAEAAADRGLDACAYPDSRRNSRWLPNTAAAAGFNPALPGSILNTPRNGGAQQEARGVEGLAQGALKR